MAWIQRLQWYFRDNTLTRTIEGEICRQLHLAAKCLYRKGHNCDLGTMKDVFFI